MDFIYVILSKKSKIQREHATQFYLYRFQEQAEFIYNDGNQSHGYFRGCLMRIWHREAPGSVVFVLHVDQNGSITFVHHRVLYLNTPLSKNPLYVPFGEWIMEK